VLDKKSGTGAVCPTPDVSLLALTVDDAFTVLNAMAGRRLLNEGPWLTERYILG
jgi:hypothetical protein